MKKLLTKLTALAVLTTMTSSLTATADYIPTVYFAPQTETNDDGTITVTRSQLADGLTITADVFIDDQSKSCWSVDPKWKSSSEFIKLGNIVNPQDPFIPYAYAEEKDGELQKVKHNVTVGGNETYNTLYFTCDFGLTLSSKLTPYGENTNDYPLTSFDMVFDRNIPYGEYEIYFLTAPEDTPDQPYSNVYMKLEEGGNSPAIVPETKNMRIIVTGANKGDVNNDGKIDANDAAEILSDYSQNSTGSSSNFDENQFFAADVDENNVADANDASIILGYYAYTSTGGNMTISEFGAQS